jgi:preprotein translocase subunit SecA
MDEMRQGIGLRAYGQADPLVAYKRESHDMWGQLLANIRRQVTHSVYHVELGRQKAQRTPAAVGGRQPQPAAGADEPVPAAVGAAGQASSGRDVRRPVVGGKARKIGRNQPCPCGSGKKYKKCHGMTT